MKKIMATEGQINKARKFFGLSSLNPFSSKEDKMSKSKLGDTLNKVKAEDTLKKAQEIVDGFDAIYKELGGEDSPLKQVDKLQKAFFAREKTHQEEVDKIQKAFTSQLDKIQNSNKSEVDSLKKGLDEANLSITKLLQTPKPRKSFENVEEVERFQKAKVGGTSMSLSKDKKGISNMLFAKLDTLQKGGSGSSELESAIINLEASGTLNPRIVELLAKDNVIITQ